MNGIESFHCPLCKCKTTVDFTAYLIEKDTTIATLTAERDALQAATLRVVEAAGKVCWYDYCDDDDDVQQDIEGLRKTLADPVIVALRRE